MFTALLDGRKMIVSRLGKVGRENIDEACVIRTIVAQSNAIALTQNEDFIAKAYASLAAGWIVHIQCQKPIDGQGAGGGVADLKTLSTRARFLTHSLRHPIAPFFNEPMRRIRLINTWPAIGVSSVLFGFRRHLTVPPERNG